MPKERKLAQREETSRGKEVKETRKEGLIIPEKYMDAAMIGLLCLLVFIFFAPALTGGGLFATDTITAESFRTYLDKAAESGEFPLWVPYIFSGMPSYASLLTTGERLWDIFPILFFGINKFFGWLFANDTARIAVFYCYLSIGTYLLMRTKKATRLTGVISAIAISFSTSVIIWAMIGHSTKPVVFAMLPWVFMFVEKLRERFTLLYTGLLILAIHIMMEGSHIQMIFYSAMTIGLYLLVELVSRIVSKEAPMSVVRAGAALIVAGGFAFLMSADRYLSVMEYTDHSTRGTAPLVQSANNKQDSEGGNDYDYATMWSFSPQEIMTFLIPNYYGFGKLEYNGPATGNRDVKVPTYWGQKPFEDAAAYMGIIILALGIVGAIYFRRDAFVQFLILLSIFSLFLSFGKNGSFLYDLFYYYVPSFNKFRAPSMALAMMQFAMPLLAGYGITAFLKMRGSQPKEEKSAKKYSMGLLIGSGALLLLGIIYAAGFKTSYMESLQAHRTLGQYPAELQSFVWDSMIGDWFVTAIVLVVASVMIYMFIKGNLKQGTLMVGLVVLVVFDLWRVGYRPMEVNDTKVSEQTFQETDVVRFLQQDQSKFRIVDLTQQPSPNVWAYYLIESVNGYHAAKLRVYQDIMDLANLDQAQGSTSLVYNPFLWNLMNVKYIVADGQIFQGIEPAFRSQMNNQLVYINSTKLSRAFFVNSYQVKSNLEILKSLKTGDFVPTEVAYFEKDPKLAIEPAEATAYANIVEYKNEYINLEVNATGSNLLFLSEIYYKPGWKAYVDGKEVEIYKTNYAFRSIVVPKGKHKVEMKFISENFDMGKNLSIGANIVTFLALIFGIWQIKKKKLH